ncbi:MAG: hypothetical protein Q8R13_04045 [bacterium]|nr:hypothetical protein [bacterium]MDZ4296304.1 hypothetical protein [Patescibacteria group bacterium]
MNSKFLQIFKSRTVWTLIAMFAINGFAAVQEEMPREYLPVINAVVMAAGIYFRVYPRQRFGAAAALPPPEAPRLAAPEGRYAYQPPAPLPRPDAAFGWPASPPAAAPPVWPQPVFTFGWPAAPPVPHSPSSVPPSAPLDAGPDSNERGL